MFIIVQPNISLTSFKKYSTKYTMYVFDSLWYWLTFVMSLQKCIDRI